MRRSLPSFVVAAGLFALAGVGGGCVVVTQPGAANQPPGSAAPRPGPPINRPNQPAATAPATTPTATATPTVTATTTAPVGAPGPKTTVNGKEYTTLRSPVAFGNNDNKPTSFRGFVYFLPNTTTALPNFDTLTPAGVLFTTGFAVNAASYTEGFPGLDDARVDYFGIRYEGTFATTVNGEFTFKLESDDGARFTIDSAPVAALDGVHTAQTKSGIVKLAPGPHTFRLDYFQAAKGAVALKLTVIPPGGAERPFAVAF